MNKQLLAVSVVLALGGGIAAEALAQANPNQLIAQRSGATPEGDAPADTMYEVIRNTTSQLTSQDLAATIAYLRSLPPLAKEE